MDHEKTLGLIGLYRCGNLGDEAIWCAFIDGLRPLLPAPWRIRMIGYGPGGYESRPIPDTPDQVDSFLHEMAQDAPGARDRNLRFWLLGGGLKFLRELSGLDAIWYAGGHWIHDLSPITLAGVMLPILWARLRRINAGFVNVGAGPLTTGLGRRIAAMASRANGPLVVRDDHSSDVLCAAGVSRRPVVARDTAYLLSLPEQKTVDEAWSTSGLPDDREVIGIVPCAWFKMERLYDKNTAQVDRMIDALALQARTLAQRGFAVAFLPTMLPEDEQVCQRILDRLQAGPYFLVPTRQIPARSLMGLIGRMRALVSFRMHPVLFAYKTDTPFVALDYAPKLHSLVCDLGLERWLVALNDRWPQELSDRLDRLLADDAPFAGATPADRMLSQARGGLETAVQTLNIR